MTIGRIIVGRRTPITCSVATAVSKAIELLAEHRIGALPVVDGEELVGIFSERDVIYLLRESGAGVLALPVGQVMTAPPVTATADTSVIEALTLMTRRRIRHLPIIDGDRMTAFISIGDLVKYRLDKVESEAAALRTYIQTA